MGYHSYDLVTRACIFADRHHGYQTRPNRDRTPMMVHVGEVARLVKEAGGNDLEMAAAWLHDTVEDTDATIEKIVHIFGPAVGEIVDGLTDPPEFSRLHIAEQKARQAERIKTKSRSVKLVKMADQISNVIATAVDPPLHWDHKICLEYAYGARLIVEECVGINDYLYATFQEAYRLVLEVHS